MRCVPGRYQAVRKWSIFVVLSPPAMTPTAVARPPPDQVTTTVFFVDPAFACTFDTAYGYGRAAAAGAACADRAPKVDVLNPAASAVAVMIAPTRRPMSPDIGFTAR